MFGAEVDLGRPSQSGLAFSDVSISRCGSWRRCQANACLRLAMPIVSAVLSERRNLAVGEFNVEWALNRLVVRIAGRMS